MTLNLVLRYTNVSDSLQEVMKWRGSSRAAKHRHGANAVMRAHLADCRHGGLLSWARMEEACGKDSQRQQLGATPL